MKRFFVIIFLNCLFITAFSQRLGKVTDAVSGEPLSSASVILFSSGKKMGLIANKEGIFSLTAAYDSIKVSMVGYHSTTIFQKDFLSAQHLEIKLESAPAELSEVIIKRTTALDIIKKNNSGHSILSACGKF